jgi:uncharacterized repeat protein (TIGR02543 family)
MTKLFKGVLATMLSVGFLAGCGGNVETHVVTFWEDTVGKFYTEVEVEHGKTVEMPADPTREGFDFEGWFEDTGYVTEFEEATLIEEDLDLYGKWKKQYVPDERTFHLVGDMANTDVSYINWNATGVEGTDWDTRSYLTIAENQNLYTIEIEIGWMGKFKIKQPGEPWNEGAEFDFTDIPEASRHDYLVEADNRNIQVKTAGLYKIELETDLEQVIVTRLGDAVGAGVKPDPDPGSVLAWGMVGSMTWSGWGTNPDLEPEYKEGEAPYHFFRAVYLNVGDQFKFRTDNAWGVELGWSTSAVLPDASYITPEMDGENPKSGGNLIVATEGFYTITIQKVEEVNVLTVAPTEFVLRGPALTTGWGADGTQALELVSAVAVEEVMTYTYAGTFDLLADQFKVKLAGVGPFDGWDTSFGDSTTGSGNFELAAAGSYDVTLVVTFDAATMAFTGTATCVPHTAV